MTTIIKEPGTKQKGRSTHFAVGQNWAKAAAKLSLPTHCNSTNNPDFLTEDTLITTTALKQRSPALLCEETRLFVSELLKQRLSYLENIVSNTVSAYSNKIKSFRSTESSLWFPKIMQKNSSLANKIIINTINSSITHNHFFGGWEPNFRVYIL